MKHHPNESKKRRREDQLSLSPGAHEHNPQHLKKQHAATRRNLPVFQYKTELCRMVADNEALLVVAETVRLLDFFPFCSLKHAHIHFYSNEHAGLW